MVVTSIEGQFQHRRDLVTNLGEERGWREVGRRGGWEEERGERGEIDRAGRKSEKRGRKSEREIT